MGDGKVGENDVNANGKYLLIAVPEFAEDPIRPGVKMTSYLRLGAASTDWQTDPGGELAKLVHLAGPPGAHLNPTGEPVNIQGDEEDARPVFIDDTRDRTGCGDPHGLSVDDRKKQTKVLHTRGGWRDHSDGNRISTTYGDKVEVIRGNYKMVVLGRQDDDPSMSAGWDASGQHIQDWGYTMPGASVRVEYMQDRYTGAWHLQNTTENVIQSSNFAGDFYEYKWGDHHESTVGSENPQKYVDEKEDPRPRTNPHIIGKTWAQKIESYTGSEKWRIPEMKEETWAKVMSSLTDAESTTDTTRVSGEISESTRADSIKSVTRARKTSDETEVAEEVYEKTRAGTMRSVTDAGAIHEETKAGAMSSITIAGAQSDVTLVGAKADVLVGAAHLEIDAMLLRLSLALGFRVDISISGRLEVAWPKGLRIGPDDKNMSFSQARAALKRYASAISISDVAAAMQFVSPYIAMGLGPPPLPPP